MAFSFRVAYRREGGPRLLTRHYETWEAAIKKYRRLRSLEDARLAGEFEGTSFDSMQPLVELRLEHRVVAPWEPSPYQPSISDRDREAAREYADRLRDERRTDRHEDLF